MAALKNVLRKHRVLALDTCIWIYHLEDHPDYRALTRDILEHVSVGKCRAVVSELTMLELLVRPLQLERQDVADEHEILLSHFPNLDLLPLSREILLKAALIRAHYGLRTPDALIIATAVAGGASLIFTNDETWKRVEEITVACLNDFL